MGKLNKKQLYANWVCAQYPPNRKSTKIKAIIYLCNPLTNYFPV